MKIKAGFVLRTIGSEHIVTADGVSQVDFNKLVCLNPVAAYLWKQVWDGEFDRQELADLLTDKYDVSLETALKDAQCFIADLESAGVIE